jgi:heptosyltransferase-2
MFRHRIQPGSPGSGKPAARVAVIIGQPGIGDMVWHQPALRAIAEHHGDPVTLFARPSTQAAALFARSPEVGVVIDFERGKGRSLAPALLDLTVRLRQGRFDRVYVLSRRSTMALATAMAATPERLGFGAAGQSGLLNRGRTLDDRRVDGDGPVAQCRAFLALNGLPAPDRAPMLSASPEARSIVRARWARAPRPWFAVGASCNEPDRRWAPERFAELTQRLERRWGGTVFLYGGAHHADQIDEVLNGLAGCGAGRIVDLSREALGFDQVMALMAESRLFVGNDSGPLNVAAALGLPAFGLFGSAAPHASLSPRIRAILPDDGQPDLETGMARLGVDHVLRSVEAVLDAPAPSDRTEVS